MTSRIWIDGIEGPVESARLAIHVNELPWRTEDDRRAYGTDSRAVCYSLTIAIDERSGDDGAPCPGSECLPVWRAFGGRHPSLTELGELTLPDGDGWYAWFGNDAPPLSENHLQFNGWVSPTRVRVVWSAKYADDPRFLENPDGPEPGMMKFEGEAEFLGISTTVDQPEDADRVIASIWGAHQLASLERHDGDWLALRELRPDFQSRLPDAWGRWLAGRSLFRSLRRKILSVSYLPKT